METQKYSMSVHGLEVLVQGHGGNIHKGGVHRGSPGFPRCFGRRKIRAKLSQQKKPCHLAHIVVW